MMMMTARVTLTLHRAFGRAVRRAVLPLALLLASPITAPASAQTPLTLAEAIRLATERGEAVVWDLPSGRRRYSLPDHDVYLLSGSLSPDGRYLVTGDLELVRIRDARTGRPLVELPGGGEASLARDGRTVRIEARPVVLVEGILLFAEPAIRELLDFKVYVDTDPDVRLVRRIRRDMTERSRAVGDVLRQYMTTVRPMHLEFVEPSKRWADVIVPEGGENRVALEMVIARIEQLLAAERALSGV